MKRLLCCITALFSLWGCESDPLPGNGQWRIINYWAIWCAPCREEIPELNELDRSTELVVLAVNYDGIRLPLPYPSANLWLLSPRLDVTFSKSLFWSTVFQYSNQRENLGINSRLQWRFAPLSDLYLVYNDNYGTSPFMPTFRSLNLKATYWLNL